MAFAAPKKKLTPAEEQKEAEAGIAEVTEGVIAAKAAAKAFGITDEDFVMFLYHETEEHEDNLAAIGQAVEGARKAFGPNAKSSTIVAMYYEMFPPDEEESN